MKRLLLVMITSAPFYAWAGNDGGFDAATYWADMPEQVAMARLVPAPQPAPSEPAPSEPAPSEPAPAPAPAPSEPAQPAPAPEQPQAYTMTITWDGPTTNVDGTCATGMDSYQIHYGLSPSSYSERVDLPVRSLSGVPSGRRSACGEATRYTYQVEGLGQGAWYVVVQAIDRNGNVSGFSNEAIKMLQ